MRLFALVAAVAFTTLSSGCGTKGPLYLPKKPAATPAPAAATQPANPSDSAAGPESDKPAK